MKEKNNYKICKHCNGCGNYIDMPCPPCKGLGYMKNNNQ
jgi:DnaJ-class molecular chaperone